MGYSLTTILGLGEPNAARYHHILPLEGVESDEASDYFRNMPLKAFAQTKKGLKESGANLVVD